MLGLFLSNRPKRPKEQQEAGLAYTFGFCLNRKANIIQGFLAVPAFQNMIVLVIQIWNDTETLHEAEKFPFLDSVVNSVQ